MNKLIILWYGLRRSGNHGIQDLFLNSSNMDFVHLNDTKLNYDKFIEYSNIQKTYKRIDGKYIGFKNIECVLISMENILLDNVELLNIKKFDNFNVKKILLLRNPINNLASIWKVYNKNSSILFHVRNLWIEYAKLILNTNIEEEFIVIIYDKFYKNIEYRNEIFNKIYTNVFCDEKYLNIKNGYATSSFVDIKNENLNEYNRYIFYEDDDFFNKEITQNNILIELWKNICEKYNVL